GVDPINAGAEVGGIEIARENFFLAEATLHPARKDRLLDLALDGALGGEVRHARELLRDRASAFARTSRNHVANRGAQRRGKVESAVLVEVPVFNSNDRAGKIGGYVLRGELVALEHAARGKDLAVGRLDDERAWGRFDHQPSVGRDGGNAVDDVSHGNDDERSERRDHDVHPPQPKHAGARRLQTASNFGWARGSVANGSESATSRRMLSSLPEQEGPHRVQS